MLVREFNTNHEQRFETYTAVRERLKTMKMGAVGVVGVGCGSAAVVPRAGTHAPEKETWMEVRVRFTTRRRSAG